MKIDQAKNVKQIFQRTVLIAVILSAVIGISALAYSYKFIETIVMEHTESQMEQEAEIISVVREVYSNEIAAKSKLGGFSMSHENMGKPRSLPLPATFAKLIAERLNKKSDLNIKTHLYSDFPFPWRINENKEVVDTGRKLAIEYLRASGEDSYFYTHKSNGETFIRLARADRMQESCVKCHNAHASSPKTNWAVGDVRGVLEVGMPYSFESQQLQAKLRKPMLVIISIILLGFTSVFFVLRKFKSITELSLASLDEVTRQKRQLELAEEKVLQIDKLASLGRLAAGVGHEINNPLTIIMGYLKILLNSERKQKIISVKKEREYKSKMFDSCVRIQEIVSALKEFAHPGTLGSQTTEKVFCLNDLLTNITKLHKTIYAKEGVGINYTYTGNGQRALVFGSSSRIQQVIVNLLSKAKDAIEKQNAPQIDVRIEFSKGKYHIFICDNGSGIPVENRKKIFDPFFTTKEVGKGMGMGLAVAATIMREQKGKIDFKTSSEGTIFQLSFSPAKSNLTTLNILNNEFRRVHQVSVPRLTGKVLVVDDEEGVRFALKNILVRTGVSTLSFDDANSALEEIVKGKVDVVLTDLQMPKMSGQNFIKKIKNLKLKNSPKIIVITGGLAEDFLNPESELAPLVEGVIFKPFDDEYVYSILSKAMMELPHKKSRKVG